MAVVVLAPAVAILGMAAQVLVAVATDPDLPRRTRLTALGLAGVSGAGAVGLGWWLAG